MKGVRIHGLELRSSWVEEGEGSVYFPFVQLEDIGVVEGFALRFEGCVAGHRRYEI